MVFGGQRQIDTRSAAKLVASLVGHDNVISLSRLILKLLGGDYPAAVLLCQSIYWQSKVEAGKGGTKDGYFWKSMSDWHRETALSEYQVRSATKRLLKAGFLKTTVRKAWSDQSRDMVPTVHYLVYMDNILESLLSLVSADSIPKKINFQIKEKCRIDSEEIDATLYTETTKKTKTTTTLSPSSFSAARLKPTAQDAGGGSEDAKEYIRLAAEDYCRSKNLGPEGLAGTINSIQKRLASQGGMTEIDQQQLSAFRKRKQEVQAMRARRAVHAEIIPLPWPDEPPVWRQAKEHLRDTLPTDTYFLWIEPLICIAQEGNTLDLAGTDPYFCSWVKNNCLADIQDALQDVGLMGAKVRLTVAVADAVEMR
jgi:hypothetical protein